ncbi:MAG TPA: penicillin-binding protein, partial [Candidatus Sphingobacterium stercorigallinarum]|nr:penicillin-binding protein [Candidatus Sphingobacterium stercorigallinarum]
MFKRVRNKFLRIALILIYGVILFTCAVQINFLGLFGSSPTKSEILLPQLDVSSELFTADSVLIGRYYKQDRDPVPFDSISENIIEALIATEDVRFYKHQGVDLIGVFGGVVSTLGGSERGGSTITQQLAKNLYRTRYKDAQGLLGRVPGVGLLVTKYKEWMTAFKLESKYSKQEILTMYLNTVSFSNNAYGIKSASVRYFDKQPSEIGVSEAAVLVGMLKATTLYNPIRNPENARQRRNVVLGQMAKEGYLSADELDARRADSLGLNLNNQEIRSANDSYLRTAVEKWLDEWSEREGIDIYTSGLKIYTSIDSRMQQIAERAVAQQMKELQNRLDHAWEGEQPWRDKEGNVIPDFLEDQAKKLPIYASLMEKYGDHDQVLAALRVKKNMEVFTWDGMASVDYSTMDSLEHYLTMLNTGMMAMDPYSGEIKVWVGGINHQYFKFDHVNQAKR